MPELPEVQTIINTLKDTTLLKHTIKHVEIVIEKVLKNCSVSKFKSFLMSEQIIDIQRKGKYIIFHLSNDKYWVVHLRMEGKLFYFKSGCNFTSNHLMAKIVFTNDSILCYYDSRMFGTFHIFSSRLSCFSSEILKKVAIDPLDKKFNEYFLFEKIKNSHKHIKSLLLDQTIVSGIGNIYADEILFMSKIHPLSKGINIDISMCKKIVKYSKLILKKAIDHKGTTILSYKYKKNNHGNYQKYLLVHSHSGEKCKICGTRILKLKINGRGTYFCPKCQKIIEDNELC